MHNNNKKATRYRPCSSGILAKRALAILSSWTFVLVGGSRLRNRRNATTIHDQTLRLDINHQRGLQPQQKTTTKYDVIDFEGFSPGDWVGYVGHGTVVTARPVTATSGGCFGRRGDQAMIFDTSNPRKDPDLGTPNQDFGGPGEGRGGGMGSPYENRIPRNNVLIISEDCSKKRPNDNRKGGVMAFNFGRPRTVASIGLIDFKFGVNITAILAGGDRRILSTMAGVGDNGYDEAFIYVPGVVVLEVSSNTAGAIAEINLVREDGHETTLVGTTMEVSHLETTHEPTAEPPTTSPVLSATGHATDPPTATVTDQPSMVPDIVTEAPTPALSRLDPTFTTPVSYTASTDEPSVEPSNFPTDFYIFFADSFYYPEPTSDVDTSPELAPTASPMCIETLDPANQAVVWVDQSESTAQPSPEPSAGPTDFFMFIPDSISQPAEWFDPMPTTVPSPEASTEPTGFPTEPFNFIPDSFAYPQPTNTEVSTEPTDFPTPLFNFIPDSFAYPQPTPEVSCQPSSEESSAVDLDSTVDENPTLETREPSSAPDPTRTIAPSEAQLAAPVGMPGSENSLTSAPSEATSSWPTDSFIENPDSVGQPAPGEHPFETGTFAPTATSSAQSPTPAPTPDPSDRLQLDPRKTGSSCPCWEQHELDNVTAENQLADADNNHIPYSCTINQIGDISSYYILQNSFDVSPGGFVASKTASFCALRDPKETIKPTTAMEAQSCVDQIIARCREIGSSITVT